MSVCECVCVCERERERESVQVGEVVGWGGGSHLKGSVQKSRTNMLLQPFTDPGLTQQRLSCS